MGKIVRPQPVKLIFSIFTNNKENFDKAVELCEKQFGNIEEISERFIFNHTDYYEKEMGKNLFRKFLIFEKLIDREGIAKVKVKTNEIEEKFLIDDNRSVNIDPGYITLENFILFTTKNYTHRIYLESGIFADLTLIFHNKSFQSLPWTYPDYASDEIKNYLLKVREIYKKQLFGK